MNKKAMQSVVDEFLSNLCKLTFTDLDIKKGIQSLRKLHLSEEELLSIAKLHKVQTVLYQNLRKISHVEPNLVKLNVLERLSITYEKSLKHTALLVNEISPLLEQFTTKNSKNICYLKGMSVARFYPEDCPRWMRDIDIMVDELPTGYSLSDWFISHGFMYDMEEIPWIKQDHSLQNFPALYGQIVLRKDVEADYARLDIHFGRYSVSYSGYLNIDLIRNTEVLYSESKMLFLNPEACIILMLAHMPSMGYIGIKDINDFAAITKRESLNWEKLGQIICESNLIPQAIQTAKKVLDLYDQPEIASAADTLLRTLPSKNTKRTKTWISNDRGWELRARVNAFYTFDFERNVYRKGRLEAFLIASQCYLYYLPRLSVKYGKKSLTEIIIFTAQPHSDRANFKDDRRICIRMIPIKTLINSKNSLLEQDFLSRLRECFPDLIVKEYNPSLVFIRTMQGEFFITKSSLFISTVDFTIESRINEVGNKLISAIDSIFISMMYASEAK